MRLYFNGAAQTVTGSQYCLEVNGSSLLLDCGLYQGRRADTYSRNASFHFNPRKLDAVLLSHAHIDHCGNLPNLVKNGYHGPIYCTPATQDLAYLLVLDSAHIQESDIEYVNKKRARRGEPPVDPLYTIADAEQVEALLSPVELGQEFEPIPGVKVQFVEAGHILGSAAISLTITEDGRTVRLWFSGDIGRPGLPLVQDPVLPYPCDYLLMESTYGDKRHDDPQVAYDEMREVLLRTFQRHGKVIIPAFAVGRTQELVYFLNEMMSKREIPRVPVYVDSPLAVNTTDIFIKHPECFDDETRQFVLENKHPALNFDQLHYTRSVDESKALNDRHEPMVIISASGMAETGRILHHLKNNLEDQRNTVMIVSWQAPETLGRRLADREPKVMIFGEEYMVRAEVATIGGLSAHAGQDQLVAYAESVKSSVRKILMVHGEPKSSLPLIEIFKEKRLPDVIYPELYDWIDL